MNEHNTTKVFIAKAQLYHDIGRLPPRFLRRNLDHVFASHEKLLRGYANAADKIAEEHRRTRARWKPPNGAMMDEYVESDKAKLTIDSFFLRPHGSDIQSGDVVDATRSSRGDGSPHWLPHPDDRPIGCQVTVNIHCKHLAETQVYYDTRSAQIFSREDARSSRVFDVRLQSPFIIEADDLRITKEMFRDDHANFWERKLTDRYTLEIVIACMDSGGSAELIAKLEGGTPAQYASAPGDEGFLKAVWGDAETNGTFGNPGLPSLPSGDSLLNLRRAQGNKTLGLSYGLQPNMRWNTGKRDSILTTYNKHVRKLCDARQLPTPSSSEDDEPPSKKRRRPCSVRYQFWSGAFFHRSVHVADLKCIFCPNDREHPSIERLYRHYAAHHDHFSIAVDKDDQDAGAMVFKMQLKEGPQDFASELPKDNFNWRAPREAFDIAAYMNRHSHGQRTSWETEQSERIKYVGVEGMQKTTRRGRRVRPWSPALPVLELERKKTRDMLPEEVPDIPTRRRRKHRVPDVPGIYFYRTKSKQALQPRDLVSDSDEEPDEFWLIQRQRRDLRKIGLNETSQAFHELLNKYLDVEVPMSDMLVRDAMVRFVRKHKTQLASPGMGLLVREKLELLEKARITSCADMTYCMQIITDAASDCDVEMGGTEADELKKSCLPAAWHVHELLGKYASQAGSASPTRQDLTHKPTSMTPNSMVRAAYMSTKSTGGGDASLSNAARGTSKTPSSSLKIMPVAFGRLEFLCRRTNGSRQKPYYGELKDLLKDGEERIEIDDVQPQHLDWFKFLSILDRWLVYLPTSDKVVCISNQPPFLVTDEKDWHAALEQAVQEPQDHRTLVFELHTAESRQKLLGHRQSNPRNESNTDLAEVVQGEASTRLAQQPCKCGHAAVGKRGRIACTNTMCLRAFHMACIGLQKRSVNFKCPDCS